MVFTEVVEVLGQIGQQNRRCCLVTVCQRMFEADCCNLCGRGMELVSSGEFRSGLDGVTGTWLGGPRCVVGRILDPGGQHEVAHAVGGTGLHCKCGVTVHELPNQHLRPVTGIIGPGDCRAEG